jgi:hypothetical protein
MKGDRPLAADYDGDGKTDIAVWRATEGAWCVLGSSDQLELSYTLDVTTGGEAPLLGDYDGDGKIDLAIWQRALQRWRIRLSGEQWNKRIAGGYLSVNRQTKLKYVCFILVWADSLEQRPAFELGKYVSKVR